MITAITLRMLNFTFSVDSHGSSEQTDAAPEVTQSRQCYLARIIFYVTM